MSDPLKPMLAYQKCDKLRFPLLASPKLDGIRALVKDGVVLSRSLKPIPNPHVQKLFGHLHGIDGELIVGEPTAPDVFRVTEKAVMSHSGEPDVRLFAFDLWSQPDETYTSRSYHLNQAFPYETRVRVLENEWITDQEELNAYEELQLAFGYEGVMVRDPSGLYKYGRATAKEGYLTKVKRFVDAEALIVGVEELEHNDNEATINELGRTKRSSHQANKRGGDTLGALVCRTPEGVEFRIGTFDGWTAEDKKALWEAHKACGPSGLAQPMVGRYIKYRYFPVGIKVAPRHPVGLGFRDERDM